MDLDVLDEDRPVDTAAAGDSPLKGKSAVITGAFTDPRSGAKISRPDVTRLVEQAAATTASSVSANTDYLLAGDNVGASKTGKAEKLGVTIVRQDELWQWLAEAGALGCAARKQASALRPGFSAGSEPRPLGGDLPGHPEPPSCAG